MDLARDPQTDLDSEGLRTQVDLVGVNPRGLDC